MYSACFVENGIETAIMKLGSARRTFREDLHIFRLAGPLGLQHFDVKVEH